MTAEAITWDDILDNYEDFLDEYNSALDSGRIPAMEPEPVLDPPRGRPTSDNRERLDKLQAETKDVTERLAQAMQNNCSDRAADRDRVNAHRHYASLRYQPQRRSST